MITASVKLNRILGLFNMGNKIEIQRGNSDKLECSIFYQENNEPFNITGCALYFVVKRNLDDPDSAAIISKSTVSGIEIINAASGLIEITLSESDTNKLEKEYWYDLTLVTNETIPRTITIIKPSIFEIKHVVRSQLFNA